MFALTVEIHHTRTNFYMGLASLMHAVKQKQLLSNCGFLYPEYVNLPLCSPWSPQSLCSNKLRWVAIGMGGYIDSEKLPIIAMDLQWWCFIIVLANLLIHKFMQSVNPVSYPPLTHKLAHP